MSYCRWSTDDYQCDLYVYASCHGGYVTHIAAYRHIFKEPLPPFVPLREDTLDAFIERHQKVMQAIDQAELVAIGLEHDGESFQDDTLTDLSIRLEDLKKMGYRFPASIMQVIQEEITEELAVKG